MQVYFFYLQTTDLVNDNIKRILYYFTQFIFLPNFFHSKKSNKNFKKGNCLVASSSEFDHLILGTLYLDTMHKFRY